MNTLKNKISNYKPKPDPELWAKIESQVIDLNQEVKSSKSHWQRLIIVFFIGLPLLAISFYGIKSLSFSIEKSTDAVKSQLEIGLNENSKSQSIFKVNAETNKDEDTNQNEVNEIPNFSSDKFKNQISQSKQNERIENQYVSNTSKTPNKNIYNHSQNESPVKQPAANRKNPKNTESKPTDTNMAIKNALESQVEITEADLAVTDIKTEATKLQSQEYKNIEIAKLNQLSFPILEILNVEKVYSKYDGKDVLSPCNPKTSKNNNIEIGGSFGIGTHLYPGYFTNFMLDFRLNKLVRAGIKINHQRYDDSAKFITYPNVLNGSRYTNLLANISLMLIDNQKLSLGIDLSPGLGLVTDNQRKQNGDDFYLLQEQYYGFNYMVGAHLDYSILKRWKLGWESVVDVNGETTIHGLRIKYIL
jgi:hypothetical protein